MKKFITILSLLVLTATTLSAQWYTVGASDWSKTKGTYTEKTGGTGVLSTSDVITFNDEVRAPKLEITCHEGKTDFLIALDAHMTVRGDSVEYIAIQFSKDSTIARESIVKSKWERLATGTGWYVPLYASHDMLQVLLHNNRFMVKFVDATGTTHRVQFILGDVKKEVDKLTALCPNTKF